MDGVSADLIPRAPMTAEQVAHHQLRPRAGGPEERVPRPGPATYLLLVGYLSPSSGTLAVLKSVKSQKDLLTDLSSG